MIGIVPKLYYNVAQPATELPPPFLFLKRFSIRGPNWNLKPSSLQVKAQQPTALMRSMGALSLSLGGVLPKLQ